MDILVSLVSGGGVWILAGVITVVAWIIRSYYAGRHRDDRIEDRLATIETWQVNHNIETGSIDTKLDAFITEMRDSFHQMDIRLDRIERGNAG